MLNSKNFLVLISLIKRSTQTSEKKTLNCQDLLGGSTGPLFRPPFFEYHSYQNQCLPKS